MSIRRCHGVVAAIVAALAVGAPLSRATLGAQNPSRVTVEGRVYDSLARVPLAGATVNFVRADSRTKSYTATSDSAGRYSLPDLEAGSYIAGFFHPVLDAIALEPPIRRVEIGNDRRSTARVDLAVPSSDHIRTAICGERETRDSTGVFVGRVRDATTGAALESATVTAEWMAIKMVDGRLGFGPAKQRATTGANGGFAFCGLTTQLPVTIVANAGAASSGELSLSVPARAIVHRDLFVGPVQSIAQIPADTAIDDSLRVPVQPLRRGPAVLRGLVRDANRHAPLPDVQVTVLGTGLTTTADKQGAFTLAQLPLGTRMVVARKIGYVPVEQLVDLRPDTAHVTFDVPTVKSVMDTVRIVANRTYAADRNGFYSRQRMGFGHHFDAEQIERLNTFATSSLLIRVPNVRISSSGLNRQVLISDGFGKFCSPPIYVDGFVQSDLTVDDLDGLVPPDQIEGLEVYTRQGGVPPQFRSPILSAGCGAIVIWTQSPQSRPRKP